MHTTSLTLPSHQWPNTMQQVLGPHTRGRGGSKLHHHWPQCSRRDSQEIENIHVWKISMSETNRHFCDMKKPQKSLWDLIQGSMWGTPTTEHFTFLQIQNQTSPTQPSWLRGTRGSESWRRLACIPLGHVGWNTLFGWLRWLCNPGDLC